jgi:hypothetical protein
MKKVSMAYLLCIFLAACSIASAQSVSKCFRADWLQGERTVKMEIQGSKVTGTFSVSNGGGEQASDGTDYKFSGTLKGNTLNVAFARNKLPDVSPSEMKSLVWTLVKAGDQESLRIKVRGKNYNTNLYEDSFADFESCDALDYAAFAKTAQTVRFAKGARSASFNLTARKEFQAMAAPATFLISVAKSQSLEIRADGCTIEVYLPNKKPYEFVEWENESKTERTYASSQIDTMLIESLPQTGAYLIVLRKPTENMQPEKVTFKATN